MSILSDNQCSIITQYLPITQAQIHKQIDEQNYLITNESAYLSVTYK